MSWYLAFDTAALNMKRRPQAGRHSRLILAALLAAGNISLCRARLSFSERGSPMEPEVDVAPIMLGAAAGALVGSSGILGDLSGSLAESAGSDRVYGIADENAAMGSTSPVPDEILQIGIEQLPPLLRDDDSTGTRDADVGTSASPKAKTPANGAVFLRESEATTTVDLQKAFADMDAEVVKMADERGISLTTLTTTTLSTTTVSTTTTTNAFDGLKSEIEVVAARTHR
eukprot:TRINITY_DN61765_c0_g1_i1.p1 TRINITY_DN61765_c0_g1~~TRINITY_DN61765_c0_g1_i1.p1  ORF type:complete len:229 (+),score=46.45 TRINITY_DN61765_c0_g1_i1:28-714(+)